MYTFHYCSFVDIVPYSLLTISFKGIIGKTIDYFPPLKTYMELSGTMKDSYQEKKLSRQNQTYFSMTFIQSTWCNFKFKNM